MSHPSLGQMVSDRATRSPDGVALRVRRGGAFADVTWREVLPRLEAVGAGLLSIPGGLPEAATVTIIGNTRLEWVLCDFGAMMVGLRTVPVYASLLSDEVGYCHWDTQALVAICEDRSQLEKVRAMRAGFRFFDKDYAPEQVPLRHIVVIDPAGLEPADDWESLDALERRGAERLTSMREEIARRKAAIRREQIATYTYTSGTTGPPKAVIQTHHNMLSMLESAEAVALFNEAVRSHGLFLFLPLAHSFGRLIELAGPFFAAPLVLSSVPTLGEDLVLSKPGFFPGAPRVFEKMKAKIEGAVAGAPPMRQRLFRWAMGVGERAIPARSSGLPVPFWLGLQLRIADALVLSKLRARLGFDNLEFALSGSAPLSPAVHTFFMSMGVTLLEGYGLTETCPALTATGPGRIRVGTVGMPFPGVTLRIADDGEVLAKGANITQGYNNRPDANADAFDAEGWFHTGDLGAIDSDGFLVITGRKKELLKTSGGKYIAPVKLENRLKGLVFVQEVVVIGDNRNFCTALFSIDKEGLEIWAGQQGVAADPTGKPVCDAIQRHVDGVNKGLASFETVKYFRVLPEPMSVENGVLTASLKVKRRVVEERYRGQIEEMYR